MLSGQEPSGPVDISTAGLEEIAAYELQINDPYATGAVQIQISGNRLLTMENNKLWISQSSPSGFAEETLVLSENLYQGENYQNYTPKYFPQDDTIYFLEETNGQVDLIATNSYGDSRFVILSDLSSFEFDLDYVLGTSGSNREAIVWANYTLYKMVGFTIEKRLFSRVASFGYLPWHDRVVFIQRNQNTPINIIFNSNNPVRGSGRLLITDSDGENSQVIHNNVVYCEYFRLQDVLFFAVPRDFYRADIYFTKKIGNLYKTSVDPVATNVAFRTFRFEHFFESIESKELHNRPAYKFLQRSLGMVILQINRTSGLSPVAPHSTDLVYIDLKTREYTTIARNIADFDMSVRTQNIVYYQDQGNGLTKIVRLNLETRVDEVLDTNVVVARRTLKYDVMDEVLAYTKGSSDNMELIIKKVSTNEVLFAINNILIEKTEDIYFHPDHKLIVSYTNTQNQTKYTTVIDYTRGYYFTLPTNYLTATPSFDYFATVEARAQTPNAIVYTIKDLEDIAEQITLPTPTPQPTPTEVEPTPTPTEEPITPRGQGEQIEQINEIFEDGELSQEDQEIINQIIEEAYSDGEIDEEEKQVIQTIVDNAFEDGQITPEEQQIINDIIERAFEDGELSDNEKEILNTIVEDAFRDDQITPEGQQIIQSIIDNIFEDGQLTDNEKEVLNTIIDNATKDGELSPEEQELLQSIVDNIMQDGQITPEEQDILTNLVESLVQDSQITPEEKEILDNLLDQFFEDGELSPEEQAIISAMLDKMQEDGVISEDEKEILRGLIDRMLEDGELSEDEKAILENIIQAMLEDGTITDAERDIIETIIQALIDKGIELYNEEDYPRAENLFNDAIELGRAGDSQLDYLAFYWLGKTYKAQDRIEEAEQAFNDSIEAKEDFALSHFELGEIYYDRQEDDQAINEYNRAIELNQQLAMAYYKLGVLNLIRHNYENAVDLFETALSIEDNPPEALGLNVEYQRNAHYNIGLAYKAQGYFDPAIDEFEASVELDPEYVKPYIGLGEIYYKLDDYNQALAYINLGLGLDPLNFYLNFNAGKAYDEMRIVADDQRMVDEYIEKALNYYQTATNIRPDDFEARYNYANMLSINGQYQQALSQLQLAQEINQEKIEAGQMESLDYDLVTLMASIYLQMENHEQARQLYQNAIALDPENAEGYLGLASLTLSVGEDIQDTETRVNLFNRALDLLQTADSLTDDNRIYMLMGQAHYWLGETDETHFQEAIDFYTRVTQEDENNYLAFKNLGNSYLRIEDNENAIANYLAAIDLNPNDPENYYNLGLAYLNNEQLEEALQTFQQLKNDIDPTYMQQDVQNFINNIQTMMEDE